MKRLALALVVAAGLAAPAQAANCAKDFKDFWEQFNNGPAKGLAGERLAIVARSALRAYDACNAGDENSASSLFKKLNEAAPAKGDDYWKQLQEAAPAKK